MIIQALCEYRERLLEENRRALPPPGFESKSIEFVIVLNECGEFLGFEDWRTGEGKKKRGRRTYVPTGERTSGIKPYTLWDNVGYVLGVDLKDKPDRAARQNEAFVSRCCQLASRLPGDRGVEAVKLFYDRLDLGELKQQTQWEDVSGTNVNLSFRLAGDDALLVCQSKLVEGFVQDELQGKGTIRGMCAVSGATTDIERLHPAIKGVAGGLTTGGMIVSFNDEAYNSHGKTQSFNASIGVRAASAYTSGLNHLLRRESRQKFVLGDTTLVFWSERQHPVEDVLAGCLGDDPEEGVGTLRTLFAAPFQGVAHAGSENVRFHVLGLSANQARLCVRLWDVAPASTVARRILQHFEDIAIVHGKNRPPLLSSYALMKSLAAERDLDRLSPRLPAEFLRAVFTGHGYPDTLCRAALSRSRIEGVNYERASLIKGWLVRRNHVTGDAGKEAMVSLDRCNENQGYLLGRLFAVLERVQASALGQNIGAAIADKYFGSASCTPRVVFPQLMRLRRHHLAKLQTPQRIFFEKLIAETLSDVHDFPANLSMADQGQFAIGYYHQQQHLFRSKKGGTENVEDRDD